MNKNIEEIITDLFPDEDNQMYALRFEALYGLVFENAHNAEFPFLKREIVMCESNFVANTRLEAKSYQNLTPEAVMQMYIGIAFVYARMRAEQDTPILCASYLRDIFSELITQEYISHNVKEANRQQISEALMDFSYAAGKTDNMSFRLRNILR